MSHDRIGGFRFGLPVLALAAGILSSGCSSFRSSRAIDVAPFAQNTVGMMSIVKGAAGKAASFP